MATCSRVVGAYLVHVYTHGRYLFCSITGWHIIFDKTERPVSVCCNVDLLLVSGWFYICSCSIPVSIPSGRWMFSSIFSSCCLADSIFGSCCLSDSPSSRCCLADSLFSNCCLGVSMISSCCLGDSIFSGQKQWWFKIGEWLVQYWFNLLAKNGQEFNVWKFNNYLTLGT